MSGHSRSDTERISRVQAEKERGLLGTDYASPCPMCGGVVFEWWDSDTCRDCKDSDDENATEQTTLVTDGGQIEYGEASSVVFDRWLGKADENIAEWGLQDEETLLLAMQEELGELTQAVLEARAEGGDPARIEEELDDLGALLLQFHEARNHCDVQAGTEHTVVSE